MNAVYHITARGNRKEPIYYSDDDRQAFLDKLGETCEKCSFVCYTYSLMDNHYHLFYKDLFFKYIRRDALFKRLLYQLV